MLSFIFPLNSYGYERTSTRIEIVERFFPLSYAPPCSSIERTNRSPKFESLDKITNPHFTCTHSLWVYPNVYRCFVSFQKKIHFRFTSPGQITGKNNLWANVTTFLKRFVVLSTHCEFFYKFLMEFFLFFNKNLYIKLFNVYKCKLKKL